VTRSAQRQRNPGTRSIASRPREPQGRSNDHTVDREAGSITLWLLGLCVTVLFLGGLSLDLWRGFSERRALANLADTAAVAGAAGVDESHFRETGEVRLDALLARRLAYDHAATQEPPVSFTGLTVTAGTDGVAVTATGEVPLTLLRVLVPAEPWRLAVTVTAEPRIGL
jgi:hypothetical protein